MKNIVITSATRTAVGSLNRSLKNVQGYELGSAVIRESIVRSKIKNEEVDEIIFGQVLTGGAGQNPARQASIHTLLLEFLFLNVLFLFQFRVGFE